MGTPGLLLAGFVIPGLVEDIRFGSWDRQVQYTSQFGLEGVTVLDGGRTTREFMCPMHVFGLYTNFPSLESFMNNLEAEIGLNGSLTEFDLNGTQVRVTAAVELVGVHKKFFRFDPDLLWWYRADIAFRQLAPPA